MEINSQDENGENVVGAVAVIGAGIGGMQAALDLADGGFKVYLADSGPAIGGTMAQLDKTFPTNDCAMCIMSPKLVETGRHLNIEILTLSEVESIAGAAGNFNLRLKRKPRFVDVEKCTGCGDCAAACPIERPDEFNAGLATRKAVYKRYPQATPNAFAIEKRGEAPCRSACPIEQRAMGYVALVRERRFADAYRTIREDNPFPSVCGRVCSHRCEESCSRGAAGEDPVSIMRIKRFVSDWARLHPEAINLAPPPAAPRVGARPEAVAVIGSGPAGLTCAADLARAGYRVTVFEALPVPGGMMRVGIPSYRLPYEQLQQDVDDVLALGVDLQLNRPVDDAAALLEQGFAAVFVAVGAHAGSRLPIAGSGLPQVQVATEFLRRVSLGEADPGVRERRVLVIGGGNVAVDAAMSAVRLGADWVGMACLESRPQMPAHGWELADAEDEGISLYPARTFKEIVAENGQVAGVRLAAIDFRGFVAGKPDFDELPGTEAVLACDVVIFAIGQRPELDLLKGKVAAARGRIVADGVTGATDRPGIFAGGDAVTGTAFVVDAIAAGHRAAAAIAAYVASNAAGAAGTAAASELPPPPQSVRPWPPVLPATEPATKADLSADEAHSLAAARPAPPRAQPFRRLAAERKQDFAEVEAAFTEAQAVAEAARCLECGICSECLQCVYACRAGAIRHDDRPSFLDLNVGAVILTPGLKTMPGDIRPEFGYGRYANVVTSIEFERMLSASGPYGGVVRRPSDGAHPHKVAFIQCVGSRDLACSTPAAGGGHDYCSSVCCMYATKEAIIAREHDANIEPTIFYMDIRAFGKGFERYYHRAEDEQGVRYVRSLVSVVKEVPGSRSLRLLYAGPDGKSREETFDLVVLSMGLQPSDGTRDLAERLGVSLNRFGFAESPAYGPARTNVPGILVAGAFAAPKDIPETVIEASCAAAEAARLLAPARGTLTHEPVYPPERDIAREEPRVGVFVCHCGINIGGVVRVPEVVEAARQLPNVVYAEHNLYTCSQDTQERIKQRIAEHGINRVVVASCTPRTHEPLFQDTIRQAGLNPYLFELANIREQDSWVHRADRDAATSKARDIASMAVAKATRLRPLYRQSLDMDHRGLVVGGGLAGLTAALSLAEQGFDVHLVERSDALGGNLRHIHVPLLQPDALVGTQAGSADIALNQASGETAGQRLGPLASSRPRSSEPVPAGTGPGAAALPGDHSHEAVNPAGLRDPQALLHALIGRVSRNPRIHLYLNSEIVDVAGYVGQYRTTIRDSAGRTEELVHGAAVIATGGRAIEPAEYQYGQHPAVITQQALEGRLAAAPAGQALARSVVMIQCVGSRDEAHPYCSRICCTQAVKNALALKARDPAAQVAILYRDIRTFGFRELLYRRAREEGVLFLEYSEREKPAVRDAGAGRLAVDVTLQPDGERLALDADLVVLAAGIEPEPGNGALAQLFKVPLSEDGFFLEAHAKLRPLDFAADGVYLAGLAHSPRFVEETIAQANGAAVRAAALLSRKQLQSAAITANVNPRLCSGCGICVEVCPYGARVIDEEHGHARVLEVLCQGCGACVAACPNGASAQRGFEYRQIFGMVDAALQQL